MVGAEVRFSKRWEGAAGACAGARRPASPRLSQSYRTECLNGPRVVKRLEPDVGLLRHRARRHADRLDGRSEIKIRHDEQRLEGDPPRPARVLHAVWLPD